MVFSIIKKSQLEGAHRLDAEYYQPEYLYSIETISKHKTARFKDILDDIRYGLYVEPDYQERGVNFLRALNLVEYGIDGEVLKIKGEEIPNKDYLLSVGDILVVRSGANTGNVGIIEKYLENSTFGSYTIRLRTKMINPYFLHVFLCGRFGRLQTKRLQTGMAQPNLNIPNIEEIKVPVDISSELQEETEKSILRAFKIKEQVKSLYLQAENLFLTELGLKNIKNGDSLFAIISLLEAKEARRLDAEYFNSPCNKMLLALAKGHTAKLGDLAEMTKGIEPGVEAYQDEGKLFIRVSSISQDGLISKTQKYISEELYKEYKDDYQPHVGEILLTKDASPGMACVVREPVEGIISSGVMRLKLKEKINSDYLALVLNSMVGRLQAARDAGGSIIAHWKPEQIKNVVVPILPIPTQNKIADLLLQSYQARKKATKFLSSHTM